MTSKPESDESGMTQMPSQTRTGQTGELASSSAIGRRLKAYYEDVASEPIPDRFLSLLETLDTVERNAGRGSNS